MQTHSDGSTCKCPAECTEYCKDMATKYGPQWWRLPDCCICLVEFPSSTPNRAKYDAPIRGGGGAWGYLCDAHSSHGISLVKLR